MKQSNRIAFFCDGHIGSTIPLIKRFVESGIAVDLYYWAVGGVYQLESVNCIYVPSHIGVELVELKNRGSLNDYLSSPLFNLYCINVPFFYHKVRAYRLFVNFFNYRAAHIKTNSFVKSKNYDRLIFVGRHNSSMHFFNLLKNVKGRIYVDLHEVCNHADKNFQTVPPIIEYIAKNNLQIIIHSKKILLDVLDYECIEERNISVIHFGIFELYNAIKPRKSVLPPDCTDYILYFGIVSAYKGIDVLYEASKLLDNKIKIVVAGKGHDDSLELMKKDEKFIVINRFIDNDELITLIKNSHCIVCPYKTMSQSGIPQTVFVFNKPIIASGLDGFKEIISDENNGLLFDTGNPNDLASKIMLSYSSDLYAKLCSNIENINLSDSTFSWKYIFNQYLSIFDL